MGINSMKSNKYMLRNTPATSNNKEVEVELELELETQGK